MASEKFAGGHGPLAFGLDSDNVQPAAAGCDAELIAVSDSDRPWNSARSFGRYQGSKQDQSRSVEKGVGVRPRMQATNQVVNALRGPLPVNEAVLFREPGCIGRGAVGLRRLPR